MAYGSRDERRARMKAAVERQMQEHPEWYDGSYNDSPTGGYTQKRVKAEAETAVKAAQQSEYRLQRLAAQRAAMEQRNAAARTAAAGAAAGIAGRYAYENPGAAPALRPETPYSVSDKLPYSYHAAKQAQANGLTGRQLEGRMKIAQGLLQQADAQERAQQERERLLALDVADTEKKIAAAQGLLERVDSDQNAMPAAEYEKLEQTVAETEARLRRDIRLHKLYMAEEGVLTAPDFDAYSRRGAEMENPTWEEASRGLSIGDWRPFAKEIANPVTFSQNKENLDKAALQQITANGGGGLVNRSYQHMSDEETSIYNYLLAKEGKEKAQEYLDMLEEGLNARSGLAMAGRMNDNRPMQLAFGAMAGLDQFATGMRQNLSKEALPSTEIQYASGAVREDLGEWGLKLPEWLGGSTLGQAAYDAVTTSANMAPSILLSTVTAHLGAPKWLAEGVGSLTLGTSAGGNAYNEMVKQGYDPKQARNYAALVGASEAGLSYLLGGISKLGGKATGHAARTAVRNIDSALGRIAVEGIIDATGEGVEEYLQEILEPAFRNLCFGEDNELRLFTPDAAYSFLMGALTAGIMEGPSTVKNGLSASQRGKNVVTAGKDAELMERAAQSPDGKTASMAREMQEGRIRRNNSNLGELLTAYAEAGGDLSFMMEPKETAADGAEGASPAATEADPLRAAAYQAAGEAQTRTERARAALETEGNQTGQGAEATFNESGARARVMGIASVEDGTVYVRLEDGGTAAADDLSFDDPALDRLYGEAGMLDAQGARSFIAGYDGTTPAPAYASGFMAAYGAARTGKSQEQARAASPYAAELPAASFQYAYAAGENARSGAKQDGGPKYSIRYDSENRPYVEVDEDILAGVPRKDWVKTVRDNLAKKFPNGVTIGNNVIHINGKSRKEITYSKYMQWALQNDQAAYADKLRATDNADEMLRASREYVNEALMHPRKDDIQEFARGEVQLRVGSNDYTASVIVATKKNGELILYDIINMQPTTIASKQKNGHSNRLYAEARSGESAVPTDTIPPKAGGVNTSIRREGQKNARPGLTRAYQAEDLTQAAKTALKKNRAQLDLIDRMARRYGVEVVLVDTLQGKTIGGTVIEADVNGLYDPESGKIYLSATAQEGAFAYVAMHEMTHYIREWNAEGYGELQRAVQAALEANGQDLEALIRYQMEQFGYDREAALEEVVANSLPSVLADEGFVRELALANRPLAVKVRAFLQELVKNLQDALDRLAQSQSWRQAAALKRDLDSLRDMEQAFAAAMEGAQENSSKQKMEYSLKLSAEDMGMSQERKANYDEYVQNALSGPNHNAHPSFIIGKIAPQLRQELLKNGVHIASNAVHTISDNNIRHIRNRHGILSDKQYGITIGDIQAIPFIIRHANRIYYNEERNGILYVADHVDTTYYVEEVVNERVLTGRQMIKAPLGQVPAAYKKIIETKKALAVSPDATLDPGAYVQDVTQPSASSDSIPSDPSQGKEKPKFSLKEGMTEEERYEALKDAEIQVPRYDGEASKLTEVEAERLARSTRRDARRYVKTLYEKFGLGKRYVNRAAEVEFEFSWRGFEESVNKQTARNADYASFGRMLASLDRIIENAIPLEIHGDKYQGTRREDPDLQRVYVLVSAYQDGGIVPVQLEIKEFVEKDNELYVAVTLNKIEAGVFTTAQHFQHEAGVLSAAVPGFNLKDAVFTTENPSEDRPAMAVRIPDAGNESGFTLSLRELLANINPEDGEFLKYVPDGFLDGAQRAAKARALERERAKLEGLKKLRFSLKDTAEVDTRALLAENERLKAALESLKAQFKLTGGHRVKPESVNRLAGRLLRQAHSSYDRATLAENLTRMFDYLGNAENPAWEELAQMGTGMIRRVLEASSEIDREAYELYAEPRAYLKETAIRLSESQREEAAAVAGSYRDYRALVGRGVKLGNRGASLDAAWQELSGMAPWLFDPEATEGEQVAQLADIVEMMQPQYVNPYGYDIDEAAYDLFLWVYNQYFDLPEMKTYADRQAQKMTRLKGEFARRLQESREEAKTRLEQAKAAHRAERAKDDLLRRWLEAKDANEQKRRRDADAQRFRERLERKEEQLLEARAKARARRQAMADTEVKQKLRKRIERTSRELSGWLLKPGEKKYVPEHLRRAVAGFLETIDLTGKGGVDTKKAQKWRERMMDVTQAMRNIDAISDDAEQSAGYATAFFDFDEGDVARMEAFTTANQGTNTLMEMDAAQLKELDFLMRNIRRTITEANRNHANRRYATVEAAAQATMEQLDAKEEKGARRGAAGVADKLLNLDQLDSFSFFRQLGPAGESVLEGLRRGFDQKVLRTREAMEYMEKATEGADLRKLSGLGAQTHTFQVTGGELTLTTAQIMELYLLNKREQARGHLYGGGIRPAETTIRAGRRTITLRKTAPVQVTEADVERITAALTPEQTRLAEEMQQFLSHQASAWGNEASMELKGYKRFTEKDYYPIRSDDHYLKTQDPQKKEGLNAIRNYGWTKSTAQHADNAVILGDIFDTFTRHVDEMATYSAFAAPLSDAMKWLNYRGLDEDGRPVSVKRSIARAYGQDAVRYIVKFLQDLNGISKAEDGPGLASLLLRNAKVAAVAANLRVALQQPTAYLRAAAEIDAKYLLKAAARRPAIAKAQQYAPIALWKSWGFFELDTGKSMRDIIVGDQSAKSRAQEKALWLAGKADDITWGALWNACELETRDRRPELTPGSESFNQAVGLRLSRIVDATQVVDSVFHRSQIMRSKNGLTGLYTSFMAEPTKSYNMLRNAVMEYREKPGKDSALHLARVGVTFAATAMATAAAAALADAFRDDEDEDEDGKVRGFGRKWLDAFAANAIDGLNPLNLIPGAKDVMSMLDGYDPSRMDLQAISKLLSAGEGLIRYLRGESQYNAYKIAYDMAQALSSLTGLPAGNLMRTFNSIYGTVSPKGIDWYNETATAAIAYENLYKAILEKDEAKAARIRKKLAEDKDAPKAPADIDAGIAKVMAEYDDRVIRAYEAREATDTETLRRLKREMMDDGFTGEMVDKAVGLYAAGQKEPGEKEMDKALDAKLYGYEHLYRAIRAAADSGQYDDVADIRRELEADSEADDPAAVVKNKVSSEMRKDYVAYVNAGKDQQADALATVLQNQFGFEDDDMRRWVLDDRRNSTVKAIDAGDIDAANRYIDEQKELGREDKDTAQSLRGLYRDQIVELYNEGKTKEMNDLVAKLSRLKLYNKDGSRCFTSEKAKEWINAAKKKSREQEKTK